MFQRTTAINKLLALKKRKRVIQGGTWAGKTYGIITILINYAILNEGKSITVVGETIPALKKGALKDFKEIMLELNRWDENNYNGTERQYTFKGGSTIEFNSFDSVGKAQAAGKRTDLFINEAPYISFDIANALMIRTSGKIWIDFNPTHTFWAHNELVGNPDVDFIILKYLDNEGLPDTIKEELLDKQRKALTNDYWKNWCRVYIDGEIGNLEGVVFNEWDLLDIIPEGAKLLGSGMDFGYTNDPTTLISAYRYDGKLIFHEDLYRKGLSNREISTFCKPLNTHIYADSAEPKSIAEIRSYGVSIQGADKGQGSINYGIDLLQKEKFYVTKSSINLIKELRNYIWAKDKEGNTLNKPIDAYNHCIDAMRYLAVMKLKNSGGNYSIR